MTEEEMNEKLSEKDSEIQELKYEVEKLEDILDDYRKWVRNCPE
jgi:chromosome segregation ATPase